MTKDLTTQVSMWATAENRPEGVFPKQDRKLRDALIKASVDVENLDDQIIDTIKEKVNVRQTALELVKLSVEEDKEELARQLAVLGVGRNGQQTPTTDNQKKKVAESDPTMVSEDNRQEASEA